MSTVNSFDALFAVVSHVMEDPAMMNRLIAKYEGTFTADQVAGMLNINRRTLDKWIKEGMWRMPQGPDGKPRMTIQEFRRQYRLTHKEPRR